MTSQFYGKGNFYQKLSCPRENQRGCKINQIILWNFVYFSQYRDYFLQPTGWNFLSNELVSHEGQKSQIWMFNFTLPLIFMNIFSLLYDLSSTVLGFLLKKCHFWILIFWISLKEFIADSLKIRICMYTINPSDQHE